MILIDILLWILKWLGILLLILLGLLIFLVLVVLLAPVRYKGRIRKTEEPEDMLFGEGKVTWLNPILRIRVRYEGKKLSYRARLFGFCIVNSDKPKKEKKKAKKEQEQTVEETVHIAEESSGTPEEKNGGAAVQFPVKKTDGEDTIAQGDTTVPENISLPGDTTETSEDAPEEQEKVSFFMKIKNFFGKIKAFFVPPFLAFSLKPFSRAVKSFSPLAFLSIFSANL